MKEMTCAQIGDNAPGTCDFKIQAENAKEMSDKAAIHAAQAHPELVKQMSTMTDEEKKVWAGEFQKRFEAAPSI